MNKKVIGVIPARYASSRLPGKPLADVSGKSLIQRVWEAVSESKLLTEVLIATDDERIMEACRKFGATAIMTPSELPSGTDRIAAACEQINIRPDYIVNIQGDEPMIDAREIDSLINDFLFFDADVGTMVKKIEDKDELFDPSVVKVALDEESMALYFSRSPIPFIRNAKPEDWLENYNFFRHIGIYVYSRESLMDFTKMEPSSLEIAESLEQLRLLQSGYSYLCVETNIEMLGVDTPEDLEKVREYFKNLETGNDK